MFRLLAIVGLVLGTIIPTAVPVVSMEEFIDSEMGASGTPGLAGAITVRQLLGHTSGFSTGQGNASRPEAGGRMSWLATGRHDEQLRRRRRDP